MSEPNTTGFASHDQTTLIDAAGDDATASPVPPQENGPAIAVKTIKRALFTWLTRWPSRITIIALVVILLAGGFATRQVLTYGALIPSIADGWYGPYFVPQPDAQHYAHLFSIYIRFAPGQGNQLSATTSSCSASGSTVQHTQAPTTGLTFTGTFDGTHFTMTPPEGDAESDLSWFGTYSTDKIHIDFYPNRIEAPIRPYADLQRGSYNDYLGTCKVQ